MVGDSRKVRSSTTTPKAVSDTRCGLGRQQRMPAQAKEVLLDADLLSTKNLQKTVGSFASTAFVARASGRQLTEIRLAGGKRSIINFSVGTQRQTVQNHRNAPAPCSREDGCSNIRAASRQNSLVLVSRDVGHQTRPGFLSFDWI